MHFNSTLLATKILRGELSGEAVLNAWADSRRKQQINDYHIGHEVYNFPSAVLNADYNPRMTLQAKRKTDLGLSASQINSPEQVMNFNKRNRGHAS